MREDFCEELKNEIRYEHMDSPFTDVGSHFCLFNRRNDLLGIEGLAVSHDRSSMILSKRLLSVRLKAGKHIYFGPEDVNCKRTFSYYPHSIASKARSGKIEGNAVTVFINPNVLLCYFNFTNLRENSRITLSLSGETSFDTCPKEVEFSPKQSQVVVSQDNIKTDERAAKGFKVFWVLKPSFKILRFEKVEKRRWRGVAVGFDISSHEALLARQGKLEFIVVISLATENRTFATEACQSAFEQMRHPMEKIEMAKRRWNKLYASLPPISQRFKDHSRLYLHCATTLLMNTVTPSPHESFGEYFRGFTACYPNKYSYAACWPWDSSFHILAFREFDPDLARDSALIHAENQDRDGRIHWIWPCTDRSTEMDFTRSSQPPLLTWACWMYYRQTKDKKFLSQVYPVLELSCKWWYNKRDRDQDGLLEYLHCYESGLDNSPRWDVDWLGLGHLLSKARIRKSGIEAVDLNSFFVVEMKCLSKMSKELGFVDAAERWFEKSNELSSKILDVMYHPEDNLFYDVDYKSHEFRKTLTLACFTPLWASVPIARDTADAMIEKYLLNEKHFFGNIPFPIVAYSEPKYDPRDFWRGPMWMNFSYLMLQVLEKHGYHAQAEKAALRIVEIAKRNKYIYEYYDSSNGEGVGIREFSCTASLLMQILLERYKESII